MSVRIELELATSDAEALMRHTLEHVPNTGDFRHDAHLREAFETLADALRIEVPWVKKNGSSPGASGA